MALTPCRRRRLSARVILLRAEKIYYLKNQDWRHFVKAARLYLIENMAIMSGVVRSRCWKKRFTNTFLDIPEKTVFFFGDNGKTVGTAEYAVKKIGGWIRKMSDFRAGKVSNLPKPWMLYRLLIGIMTWVTCSGTAAAQHPLVLRDSVISEVQVNPDSVISTVSRSGTDDFLHGFVLTPVRIKNQFSLYKKRVADSCNFSDIQFQGGFDLNKVRFLGPVTFQHDSFSNAQFTTVVFRRKADFSGSHFGSFLTSVLGDTIQFDDTAKFSGARFFRPAWFPNVLFNGPTDFTGARFDSGFYLASKGNGEIRFNGDTISGDAFFLGSFPSLSFIDAMLGQISLRATRVGSASFSDARMYSCDLAFGAFAKSVDFSGSTMKTGDFEYAAVGDSLNFDGAHVEGMLNLSVAHVGKYLGFAYLQLKDSTVIYLDNAMLPDAIDLSHLQGDFKEIDFTAASFSDPTRYDQRHNRYFGKHSIFLFKTNIARIHLDYTHFKLSFLDPATSREIAADDKEAIYESLLNNFKVRGQMESYRQLDIEYQTYKWNHSWAWWLTWLPYGWWCFGYEKELVFLWVAVFLVLFTTINFFYVRWLNKEVYPVEGVPDLPSFRGTALSRSVFRSRLWYSFVYTANIFFRLSLNVGKINYRRIGGAVYLMIIYVLGLVCLAYMANFVLQH